MVYGPAHNCFDYLYFSIKLTRTPIFTALLQYHLTFSKVKYILTKMRLNSLMKIKIIFSCYFLVYVSLCTWYCDVVSILFSYYLYNMIYQRNNISKHYFLEIIHFYLSWYLYKIIKLFASNEYITNLIAQNRHSQILIET